MLTTSEPLKLKIEKGVLFPNSAEVARKNHEGAEKKSDYPKKENQMKCKVLIVNVLNLWLVLCSLLCSSKMVLQMFFELQLTPRVH